MIVPILAMTRSAAAADPARGTPLSDLIPASIVALVLVIALAAVCTVHRRRGLGVLNAAGRASERAAGLPGWAGVPVVVTTVSLLIAVFGFYWDVSWHIDRGRDPGPFANPAHWLIIVGLAGIALAGVLAVVMGGDRPTPTSVRIRDDWHAPVGGVLLALCGVIALLGFPLDDVWHRIFGQDVTLWGPTHIEMVGGASLATLAMWVLMVEGLRQRGDTRTRMGWLVDRQEVLLGGAFLLGLSTLQGEFDYGVPQFRQVFHPVLIALAASIALVAVRIRAGKGAAIGSALFFVVIRGSLALLIGPALGRTTLHFPLYLVEAAVVELVAIAIGTDRQLTFGLWSGIGIGTIGVAFEWLWSHLWMPLPWQRGLLPLAPLVAFVAACAGGVLGSLTGRALARPDMPRQRVGRVPVTAAWLGALLVIAICLPISGPTNITADVQLVTPGPAVTPAATLVVRLHPDDAAVNAEWFNVTAWQGERNGNGGLIIAPFSRNPDGSYSTTRPVPTTGGWKTIIRLHKGATLASLPVYLPADPGIPAPGVYPRRAQTATFVRDKSVLQREAVGGSPELQRLAYTVLAVLGMAWIGSLAWGLRRLERGGLRTISTSSTVLARGRDGRPVTIVAGRD